MWNIHSLIMSSLVSDEVYTFFTCSLCFTVGCRRLLGCSNPQQHIFCEGCARRQLSCPLCADDGVKINVGMPSLNGVMELMTFPCTNSTFGCTYRCPVVERRRHLVRECAFKFVAYCPFCSAKFEGIGAEERIERLMRHWRRNHTPMRRLAGSCCCCCCSARDATAPLHRSDSPRTGAGVGVGCRRRQLRRRPPLE